MERKAHVLEKNKDQQDRVILTYYTDPLCCWCWGFEKVWQQLLTDFGDSFRVRYVMAGMIRDWTSYSDPYNSVNKPLQMGPIWVQASQLSHTEINPGIWHTDPPASSYPACIAVKTAALQSPVAEALLLSKLRQAVMTKALNIARPEVLQQLALELETEHPAIFNFKQYSDDSEHKRGHDLFRADLAQVALHKIGRFPTLTVTDQTGKGAIMVGYRNYNALLLAMRELGIGEKISSF